MERISRIGCRSYPCTYSLRTKANCRSNSNTFFSLLLSSRTIVSHTKLPAIKHYLHLGLKTRSLLYTPTLANISPQIKKILCLEIMSFASGTVCPKTLLYIAILGSIHSIISFLQTKGILQKVFFGSFSPKVLLETMSANFSLALKMVRRLCK